MEWGGGVSLQLWDVSSNSNLSFCSYKSLHTVTTLWSLPFSQ